MQQINTTIEILMARYDGQVLIPVSEASVALGMAKQTARNRLHKGNFPVKTVWSGTRRMVHVADLASYIEGLRAGSIAPKKRGRPSKAEKYKGVAGESK